MSPRVSALLSLVAVLALPAAALATDLGPPPPDTRPRIVWAEPEPLLTARQPAPALAQVERTVAPVPTTVPPTTPAVVAPVETVAPSTTKPPATKRPATQPTTTKPPATLKIDITVWPKTGLYDQDLVDEGGLVTWMTHPTCLLAGHDYAGWAWLSTVPRGSVVKVARGPCSGTYRVVGHEWHGVKGGAVPEWMSRYDLVLQTCTGDTGTGFSVARRVR